ncbi:hypothetical protein YYC_05012, partial [Plasmodium yoelii 17X]
MIPIKYKNQFVFFEFVKIINNINNSNKLLFQKINKRNQQYLFYNVNIPNQKNQNEEKKCVRYFLRFQKELDYLKNKELPNCCHADNKFDFPKIEKDEKDEKDGNCGNYEKDEKDE